MREEIVRISRVVIDLGIADLNEMLVDFLPDAKVRVTDIHEGGIIGQVKLLLWNIDFAARPNSSRPDELSIEVSASKLVPIPSLLVQKSLREAIKDAPNGIDVIQQALKVHLPSILNPLGIYVKIRELKCHNGFIRIGVEGIRLPTPNFSKQETRETRAYAEHAPSASTSSSYGARDATTPTTAATATPGNPDAAGPAPEGRPGNSREGEGSRPQPAVVPGAHWTSESSSSSQSPQSSQSVPSRQANSQPTSQPVAQPASQSGSEASPDPSSQPNPQPAWRSNSQPDADAGSQPEEEQGSLSRNLNDGTERQQGRTYPENQSAEGFLPSSSQDTHTNIRLGQQPIVRVTSQGSDKGTQPRAIDYSFTTPRRNQ